MRTQYITPGSFWIELALWLLFFPAGIIYSLWRWTSRRPVLTIHSSLPPVQVREGDIHTVADGYSIRNYRFENGQWVLLP